MCLDPLPVAGPVADVFTCASCVRAGRRMGKDTAASLSSARLA
jgi:hypothetical protein